MSTLVLTRRRTSIWSVFAILAALATGLAVYSYLAYVRSRLPISGSLVSMVVASRDINPGTVLTPSMLESVDHPSRYLPKGAFADVEGVIGKVVTVPVFRSEPIVARKLAGKGGLSSIVPPGMRAYSLSVTSGSALGFTPKPGDRVDVLATFPREVMGEATTVTLMTFKEVASAGAYSTSASGKVASQLGVDRPAGSMGLTLFVTPEEAEKLAMAEAMGRLTVILSPARPEESKPAPLRPGDLSR